MKYRDIAELCKVKNLKVKDLTERTGYSRPGLQTAIDNETIELRRLKVLCDTLRISPSLFFEEGTFGIINTIKEKNENKEIESLKKQIELLKSQIEDKNEIIALLKK